MVEAEDILEDEFEERGWDMDKLNQDRLHDAIYMLDSDIDSFIMEKMQESIRDAIFYAIQGSKYEKKFTPKEDKR